MAYNGWGLAKGGTFTKKLSLEHELKISEAKPRLWGKVLL
jgi:hypothetical protein